MKSIKTSVSLLLAIFFLNSIVLPSIFAQAITAANNENMANTIEGAQEKVDTLKTKYLQNGVKKTNAPFKGVAIDDVGPIYRYQQWQQDGTLLEENIIGMTALLKDFQATGNTISGDWAQIDVWKAISSYVPSQPKKGVARSDYYNTLDKRKYGIDQFIFLEYVSESFMLSKNPEMNSKMESLYLGLDVFNANVTYNNQSISGAYWSILDYDKPLVIYDAAEPFYDNYIYPLTNTSLWAAAGLAHFAYTRIGTESDSYSKTSLNATLKAEEAFTYAEITAWDPFYGLYEEKPIYAPGNGSIAYLVDTQIVALLACARLYQLTGKSMYLTKADLLIGNIIKYYGDAGRGGIFHAIKYGMRFGDLKLGYDNAFFAYALTQLGIATGAEEVELRGFINGRPKNQYMDLAFSFINFMNNYMWKVTPGNQIEGYVEYIDHLGNTVSFETFYTNSTKFISTNMLALFVLANIIYQNRSWFEWYETYTIIVAVALGIILFVTIIVKIRSSEGNRVSRVVKGLMEDED